VEGGGALRAHAELRRVGSDFTVSASIRRVIRRVVQGSAWILLSRNPLIFEHPIILEVKPRPLDGREVLFTDRYSNLFRVLK
jgi:hypothetical protein